MARAQRRYLALDLILDHHQPDTAAALTPATIVGSVARNFLPRHFAAAQMCS